MLKIVNPMEMTGRTILVTGASAGLGKGVAELLANLGAKVILVARNADRLEAVRQRLMGSGHGVEACDLSAVDEIPPWMRTLSQKYGLLSGVVHSAGILPLKPLRMQLAIDWEDAMRLNVMAGAALTKGFRQRGVCTDKGSVVYIASVMGLSGQSGQAIYSATKGAIVAMVRSMAVELARDNIRVNCVAPAIVNAGMTEHYQNSVPSVTFTHMTNLHPLGLGRAEDVAHAVAFLLADTGRWITGTTLVVDGGYLAQ